MKFNNIFILDKMFSRFGVLIEIFNNQGTIFHGEFQELCEKH
jgi:hypothetical protein